MLLLSAAANFAVDATATAVEATDADTAVVDDDADATAIDAVDANVAADVDVVTGLDNRDPRKKVNLTTGNIGQTCREMPIGNALSVQPSRSIAVKP